MTFFLQSAVNPDRIEPQDPPGEVSTFWEGIGAATKSAAIENDANFKLRRTQMGVREEMARTALDRMGLDSVAGLVEQQNEKARAAGMPSQVRPVPKTVEEATAIFGPRFSDQVLKMAREQAKQDPDTWSDMDLSDDAIETTVNERLQAEYEDARGVVEMMPGGQGAAEIIGGIAGPTLDVKNLPFLLLGGGAGSIMRVAATEAMLNMAAEGVFMPAQFEMAERLDIEDPNVAEQLLMAAAAGGILGGGMEALSRGIRYAAGRQEVRRPLPGYDIDQTTAMIDQAEDALASGRSDAMSEIAEIPQTTPRQPPFIDENPINPERPPLIAEPASFGGEAPVPEVVPRQAPEEEQATLDAAAQEAERAGPQGRTPLTTWLRKRDGGNQIDPDGWLGQELKRAGVDARRAPGLFKRGGRTDLDNLPADEMDQMFPGIREAAGVGEDGTYLDRDGLLEVLKRDAQGYASYLRSRQEAQAIRDSAGRTAQDDYLAGEDAGGLFIDPEAYRFDASDEQANAQIAETVTAWIDQNGFGEILTDAEKREIVGQIQKDGGDVELLVERALEREADFVETPDEPAAEIPFGEPGAPDGQSARGSEPLAGQAGERPAGEGRGDAGARQYERTAAGDQSLIPGVDAVSQRDRLQAQQEAPMRGGDRAMDGGLFDMGARLQGDMFDDMTAAPAQGRLSQITEDIRDAIETDGDFGAGITTEDGRTLTNASDVLRYLDEGDEFADVIALCGRPRGDAT